MSEWPAAAAESTQMPGLESAPRSARCRQAEHLRAPRLRQRPHGSGRTRKTLSFHHRYTVARGTPKIAQVCCTPTSGAIALAAVIRRSRSARAAYAATRARKPAVWGLDDDVGAAQSLLDLGVLALDLHVLLLGGAMCVALRGRSVVLGFRPAAQRSARRRRQSTRCLEYRRSGGKIAPMTPGSAAASHSARIFAVRSPVKVRRRGGASTLGSGAALAGCWTSTWWPSIPAPRRSLGEGPCHGHVDKRAFALRSRHRRVAHLLKSPPNPSQTLRGSPMNSL